MVWQRRSAHYSAFSLSAATLAVAFSAHNVLSTYALVHLHANSIGMRRLAMTVHLDSARLSEPLRAVTNDLVSQTPALCSRFFEVDHCMHPTHELTVSSHAHNRNPGLP